MSFGAPWFLAAGGVAALGVLALHLIVMRQPPSAVFPTTRFLPLRPAVARTVARVPEDLLLLAVRVAVVVCVSAAFARPVLHPRAVPLINLVVVDRSRDVASVREATDSARAVLASSSGGQPVIVVGVRYEASRPSTRRAQTHHSPISSALMLAATSHSG